MTTLDDHIDKYISAESNRDETKKVDIQKKAKNNYIGSYASERGLPATTNKHKYNPFVKVNNPAIVTSFNKRVQMRRIANKEAAFIQAANDRVIQTRNSVMDRAARRGDTKTLRDMGQSAMADDVINTGRKRLMGNTADVPRPAKYKTWHAKQKNLQPRKTRKWTDSKLQSGGRKKTRRHKKNRKHGKKKSRKRRKKKSRKRSKKKSRKK
jgi:hypothetical protein